METRGAKETQHHGNQNKNKRHSGKYKGEKQTEIQDRQPLWWRKSKYQQKKMDNRRWEEKDNSQPQQKEKEDEKDPQGCNKKELQEQVKEMQEKIRQIEKGEETTANATGSERNHPTGKNHTDHMDEKVTKKTDNRLESGNERSSMDCQRKINPTQGILPWMIYMWKNMDIR